jgi:alkyl sulfatase BDS1-like metallo-beta-lactamase superfamily hydrolase
MSPPEPAVPRTPGAPMMCEGPAGGDVVIDSPDFRGSPAGPQNMGQVLKLNDVAYQVSGFGNTFMVVTDEGNVVIDTSLASNAQSHRNALRAINSGPIRYIILTHAHPDHAGGVNTWREAETQVIAQSNHVEFVHYERRLAGLFGYRNSRQFASLLGGAPAAYAPENAEVVNFGGEVQADITFEAFHEFKLGGLTFQVVHTPGETYDHLTVWIPEYKIAFTGDNFYGSFPNMYTLRGTKPRWALDYVQSIDRVLSWDPAIVAPSHEQPLYGAEIKQRMTRYRDGILYVHDETVRGMNAGKNVFTLMQQIKLPPELEVPETYGAVHWTVRGIYEGYIGWFDANASNMFSTPPSDAYPEVVDMAGGASAVAMRASALVSSGEVEKGLHLADVALAAEPGNAEAVQARRAALQTLRAASVNSNEQGWLDAAINEL